MAWKDPDLRWKEVGTINCYALFMAYLLMAVRGLAFLVISWSTIVLLGGFVSDLRKKDFWSLTIITLILTPRVSADVDLKEKLRDIWYSFSGLFRAIFGTLNPKDDNDSWPRQLLAVVVWLCHLLVAPIVVCALAVLYMCGPLVSVAISMWRLIEHDYDISKKKDVCCNCNKEDSHLQPALNVLYSLAILQGLLFCYRFYSSYAREKLVNDVAGAYKMSNSDQKELVMGYLRETVTKCEKDPTFFKETNLATYAVGMIMSESSESFLIGARILDALLKHFLSNQHAPTAKDAHVLGLTEEKQQALTADDALLKPASEHASEQVALAAELIRMASSSHVLEKLLQALDSISPDEEVTRMRELAANIMAHLAGRTRVMQFPEVIQRIGSLIEPATHKLAKLQTGLPAENYWKLLMEKGFDILEKLAADEENCRAISNSQGLLSKVVAPLSSDLLHPMDHEALSTSMVAKSLQVASLLVVTPGETGDQLRSQISGDMKAIDGMGRILRCRGCSEQVHNLNREIIKQLGLGVDEESLHVIKMPPGAEGRG